MMERNNVLVKVCAVSLLVLAVPNAAWATTDTFGTGANQFTIDFVNISGDASSANGTNISPYSPGSSHCRVFTDPSKGYRIGVYEITNEQWTKFRNSYGLVVGSPSSAYNESPYWMDPHVPTNNVSWYEVAQFVNWLNTSTGHTAAYKFIGTQGTSGYSLDVWDAVDAWGGTNLYRHKDAYYFLPTEDEWVKAAYWNETNLQTWATVGDIEPTQSGWNFGSPDPWDVGSGSQELNGTYDMMGNIMEWMESPYWSGEDLSYNPAALRPERGGAMGSLIGLLDSSWRDDNYPYDEHGYLGFRVASVPEPATLLLFGFGGLALRRRRRAQQRQETNRSNGQ